MRSLPPDLVTELEKEIIHLVHLITCSFATPQRWTDCDQNIYYSANWYLSKQIRFDPPAYTLTMQTANLTLNISNVDKAFSNLVLSEEIRGKECRIERAALDKNLHVIGTPAILYLGYFDQIHIDRKNADCQIVNVFIKWKTITPRRNHSPTCWKVFKNTGAETYCGYSGAETECDHTPERCEALGNYLNFGGFRYISRMAQKEIWWGTKQKIWG